MEFENICVEDRKRLLDFGIPGIGVIKRFES
jgi:hypothetical protein